MKNRLILLVMSALFFAGASGIALATGEIDCRATDGRSGAIRMLVGRLPVLNIVSAEITAFGKTWSTADGAENPIIVGQAFEDRNQMMVDFTDSNVETILMSLRTVRVVTEGENGEYGEAGILRIAKAVYPVMCES